MAGNWPEVTRCCTALAGMRSTAATSSGVRSVSVAMPLFSGIGKTGISGLVAGKPRLWGVLAEATDSAAIRAFSTVSQQVGPAVQCVLLIASSDY